MYNLIKFLAVMTVMFSCGTKMPTKTFFKYSDKIINVPEPFADGIVSTKYSSEFDLCFTPDGKSVYFTRRTGNEKQKIWKSTLSKDVWTSPELCSFSTDRDETPFITNDGKTLYFGSTRIINGRPSKGNFDMSIWKVKWNGKDWKNPTPLGNEINAVQQEKEEWPSSNESFIFTNNGTNFLYTTMLRGKKTIEIYQTAIKGKSFTMPVKISGIFKNEKLWKSSAIISPDENYLLFSSYEAEGGMGGEDIFICKKTKSGWTEAKSIGPLVNTKGKEGSPRFSPDGKYFFFGRELRESPAKDGLWDIYYVETKYLNFEVLFNK